MYKKILVGLALLLSLGVGTSVLAWDSVSAGANSITINDAGAGSTQVIMIWSASGDYIGFARFSSGVATYTGLTSGDYKVFETSNLTDGDVAYYSGIGYAGAKGGSGIGSDHSFTIASSGGSGGGGSSTPIGISFFKPASVSGSYQPTSFIEQSASAVGATTAGFGPILATVGGILIAIGIGGYIIALFQETADKKIKK